MITLLDTMGPAVWRASWQAEAVALLVVLLLRVLGERISPRWRYLLWSVVVIRLLFVATPAAPWSAFNLVRWKMETRASEAGASEAHSGRVLDPQGAGLEARPTTGRPGTENDSPRVAGRGTETPPRLPADATAAPAIPDVTPGGTVMKSATSLLDLVRSPLIARVLSSIWLAGCLLFGLQLARTAVVLRRRLAACRPVTDAAVLKLLEAACLRIGRKRLPQLLVTPESISPCIVGTWNPRIIVPEAIVTTASSTWLRHVLAHELAHLVRGDLWTNWLLLTARIVHWFNPAAWWTIRAMQAEREAACDELALAALGEADRPAYAATIIDLATNLAPSAMAPALIGLISSARRLKARVERLLQSPSAPRIRAPFAAGLLLVIALLGLTDAMPGARAQAPKEAISTGKEKPRAKNHTISGRCFNDADSTALAGITVRLYRAEGRTSPPVEIARTVTDVDGGYTFTGLEPPRPENHFDRLTYAVFGFAANRPIGNTFHHFREKEEVVELRMALEKSTLSGEVIDSAGRPVAGASVLRHSIDGRPVPGLPAATTDAEGRFKLDNVAVYRLPDGKAWDTYFTVLHPDHPETSGKASALPVEVVVKLPDGCLVTGTVADAVTGEPAAGAVITARRADEWGESFVATEAAGRFRVVLPEGRYDFLAEAKDRVCVAVTGRECQAGEEVEVPPFTLIAGGFISGRVVNTATGAPVTVSEFGGPIMLGLFGPSQPAGRAISPARLAAVDDAGRFSVRAAPGENFPYFVNIQGNRMAWDTQKQPPVVVKEGATTTYDMLITPPIPPAEKLRAARKLVDSLPKQPAERTARILLEFRKLNHTVDETELWCPLMRDLVALGRAAVPQVCAELDLTREDRTLRRLAFALRAIGDPRAVPALIRALPKTLLPSSSDYGLLVEDRELMAFMQKHDLDGGAGGQYFNLGRPDREICGALKKLTGQNTDDAKPFGISLSEDSRRQVLQRRLYQRKAQRWQAWWESHWREFTNDAASQKVNLKVVDEALPPASQTLGASARLGDGVIGATLSPAIQEGQHATHFYDLDTGFECQWPAQIPKDESRLGQKRLAAWAEENGLDLMCITHREPDGTETFVLRGLGLKAWEISPRDLRNLDRLLAAGKLPEGREVDELLMHYDPETRQLVPDANAAFLFVTREGSLGLIETTDRVTQTRNLNGAAGDPPAGVGFFQGVRFNVRSIIP